VLASKRGRSRAAPEYGMSRVAGAARKAARGRGGGARLRLVEQHALGARAAAQQRGEQRTIRACVPGARPGVTGPAQLCGFGAPGRRAGCAPAMSISRR